MPLPIYIVDAFTTAESFSGNPAAVCVLDYELVDSWMQLVAAQMNLSETAFLTPAGDIDAFAIRWFTPKAEVALCGHATLASAHILWSTGRVDPSASIRFSTRECGDLICRRDGDCIAMDFPAAPVVPTAEPPNLALAIGCEPTAVCSAGLDLLVEAPSLASLLSAIPRFDLIAKIPVRGVALTAGVSDGGYDFACRFFAPAVGIDEDAVTGSAYCALGPYWAARLGKSNLRAHQSSDRGGDIGVNVRGKRVDISGIARTVVGGLFFG